MQKREFLLFELIIESFFKEFQTIISYFDY